MDAESEDAFAARVIGEARAKAGVSSEGMDWVANALVSVVTDQAERVLVSELAAAEVEARSVLTERVRAALVSAWLADGFIGDSFGEEHPWSPSDWGPIADAAVQVFVEFLRDPPVREVQADGTEVVRWPV